MKLLGHCLFGLLPFPHGLFKLPRQYPLDGDSFYFFPDSFFIEKAVKGRTAVVHFLAFMGVFVGGGELELFTHSRSVPCTVHSSKRERDAIRRARCGLLWDLGRLEPLALQGFPLHVSAQVFPESPQPPDHVQLPVRKMFEEAIADKTDYVLPV